MASENKGASSREPGRNRWSGLIRGSRNLVLAVVMVVGILLLSGVLNLNQTALQSQLRFGITETEAQCIRLDQDNATLSMQLAPLAALTAIEVRAGKSGLGPPTKIEYLDASPFTAPTPQAPR